MSPTINIDVSATITSIAGQPSLSSLNGLPASLAVADSASSANITLELFVSNTGANMTASSGGGVSVIANGNTLQISGTPAQVNAALATLAFTKPSGSVLDVISVSTADNAGGAEQSSFDLAVATQTSPAFVAPPRDAGHALAQPAP